MAKIRCLTTELDTLSLSNLVRLREVAMRGLTWPGGQLSRGRTQCRLACADQILELRCLQVGESDRGRPVAADGLVAWLLGGVPDASV